MKTTPPNSDLVYRPIQHQPHLLVVAARVSAFHVHQITSAIRQAKTWKGNGLKWSGCPFPPPRHAGEPEGGISPSLDQPTLPPFL